MNKDHSSTELPEQISAIAPTKMEIGALLQDRYRIVDRLGAGGMGLTFEAVDLSEEKTVAIKFLHPERISSAKDLRRFEREAKTASRLHHPGICRVIDFSALENEQPYLVMEFVEGTTLADCLEKEGQLEVADTFEIFIQISDALAYAHANGVLHRDIKPSNIMVAQQNGSLRAKLLDFGIAKSIASDESASQSITNTGELLGSPLYMSPEQARGAILDARSDLYSLGCTLYEVLTGGPPHLGQTPVATLLKRETDKPITLSEASLGKCFSQQLEQVVSRLLQVNPDDRYQTAAQIKEDLLLAREGRLPISPACPPPKPAKTLSTPLPSVRWHYHLLAVMIPILFGVFILSFFLSRPRQTIAPPPPFKNDLPPLTAADEHKLNLEYIDDHLKKGTSLCIQEQFGPAAKEFEQARELLVTERTKGAPMAQVTRGLSVCYTRLQRFSEARPLCEATVELDKNEYGQRSWQNASSLNLLGSVYILQGKQNDRAAWEKASSKFQEAQSIYRSLYGSNSIKVANCLQFEGNISASNQPLHAKPLLEKALTMYRKKGSTLQVARTLEGLARMYAVENNRSRCEACWKEAIEILANNPLEHDSELAAAIQSLFAIYTDDLKSGDVRQLKLARSLCLRYLPLFPKPPKMYLAPLFLQLGEIEMRLGEDDGTWPLHQREALPFLKQGLNLVLPTSAAATEIIPSTYMRIGQINLAQGHLAEAKEADLKGLDLLEKNHINHVALKLGMLLQLTTAYLIERDYAHVKSTAEKGLSLCEATVVCKNSFFHASFLTDLGLAYEQEKNWAQAEAHLKQARSIFASLSEKKSQAAIRDIDITLARIRSISGK